MNLKKMIALLLCIALLLTIPVSAAHDTVLLTRAALRVPAAVKGEALGEPFLDADAPFRIVSYQWRQGEAAAAVGSIVGDGAYFLEVTVRVKDATLHHVDSSSYISTEGACTALACTVDPGAGAITASFSVPVYTAMEAQLSLPEITADNIADTIYEINVTAGAQKPEVTSLLVYEGEQYLGTGLKNAGDFFMFSDAEAAFVPGHTYTVIGTALFQEGYFTKDNITVDADHDVALFADAKTVGFRWRFTQPNPPAPKAFPFTDVKEVSWYYAGVDYCFQNDLMKGTSGDRFNPSGLCSRAMLVTILYRLAGSPAQEVSSTFTDVPNGTWYTDGVLWAQSRGIVNGYGDGRFGPNDPITRQQLATILMRYVSNCIGPCIQRGELSSFPDAANVSNYAIEPLRWAVAEGLINGKASGGVAYLQPKGLATRAEVATILMRLGKADFD